MSLIERKDTREWILTGDPARVDHGPPVFPGTGVRVVPKTEWAMAARQLRGAVEALQVIYDRHHMTGDGSAGRISGDALRAMGIDPDARGTE